jgi:hypothetical protein
MNTMKTRKRRALALGIILVATVIVGIPARAFYDPSAQRWINRDPLSDQAALLAMRSLPKALIGAHLNGVKVEMIEGADPYAFVGKNPVSYIDPFGRERVQEPGFTKPGGIGGDIGPMCGILWDCGKHVPEDLWNCIPKFLPCSKNACQLMAQGRLTSCMSAIPYSCEEFIAGGAIAWLGCVAAEAAICGAVYGMTLAICEKCKNP